jgi:uncharacterized membrane protein
MFLRSSIRTPAIGPNAKPPTKAGTSLISSSRKDGKNAASGKEMSIRTKAVAASIAIFIRFLVFSFILRMPLPG